MAVICTRHDPAIGSHVHNPDGSIRHPTLRDWDDTLRAYPTYDLPHGYASPNYKQEWEIAMEFIKLLLKKNDELRRYNLRRW